MTTLHQRRLTSAGAINKTTSTLLSGLVAYWKLDESSDGSGAITRLDSSGNNLNLTDTNTTPSAAGLSERCINVEKDNAEYLLRNSEALLQGSNGTTSYTIAVWAKPSALASGLSIISKATEYALQIADTGLPTFTCYSVEAPGYFEVATAGETPAKLSITAWSLVIFGYDASVARAFIQVNNGVVYEKALTAKVSTGQFQVGRWVNNTYCFDGAIDEIGKWSRVLTASERATLWNNRLGVTIPFIDVKPVPVFRYNAKTGGATRLTNFQTAIDGGYSKILCLGDSWMEGGATGLANAPLVNGIRTSAQAEYGDAGIGFLKFQRIITDPDSRVTLYTTSGTWTANSDFTGHGVDLCEVVATNTATITFTATFDRIEVHYRQFATGGSFKYKVDAGDYTTVNTAGAEAYGKSAITGLANASHAVSIEWVSGTVSLFGAELTSGSAGCLVYRCGTSGMTSSHLANNTTFTTAVTAIDPDLTIILLGTNDITGNVAPSSFAANIATAIGNIPTSSDVLIIVSPDDARDIRTAKTYNTYTYNQAVYDLSYAVGRIGFMSAVDDFGSYGLNYPKAYWTTLHLTATGYTYLAGLIFTAFITGR